jgi:hypothetical protein
MVEFIFISVVITAILSSASTVYNLYRIDTLFDYHLIDAVIVGDAQMIGEGDE